MLHGESEERRCVEIYKLDIGRAPNESIRSWMLGALKIKGSLISAHKMTLEGVSMGEVKSKLRLTTFIKF